MSQQLDAISKECDKIYQIGREHGIRATLEAVKHFAESLKYAPRWLTDEIEEIKEEESKEVVKAPQKESNKSNNRNKKTLCGSKKPWFTWEGLNIAQGDTLISRIDSSIKVTTCGTRNVVYAGKSMSLADATKLISKQNKYDINKCEVTRYWCYKGVKLCNVQNKYDKCPNYGLLPPEPYVNEYGHKARLRGDFTWAELGFPEGSLLQCSYGLPYTATTCGRNSVKFKDSVIPLAEATARVKRLEGLSTSQAMRFLWFFNGHALDRYLKPAEQRTKDQGNGKKAA